MEHNFGVTLWRATLETALRREKNEQMKERNESHRPQFELKKLALFQKKSRCFPLTSLVSQDTIPNAS